jgi:hypothetical protein
MKASSYKKQRSSTAADGVGSCPCYCHEKGAAEFTDLVFEEDMIQCSAMCQPAVFDQFLLCKPLTFQNSASSLVALQGIIGLPLSNCDAVK